MKSVAGTVRIELAQYRALEAFAQFGSDLDKASQQQIARGQRVVEVLKQAQYQPLPVELQVASIYAVTNGKLDDVPVGDVRRFENELHEYLKTRHGDLLPRLVGSKVAGDIADELGQPSTTSRPRSSRPSRSRRSRGAQRGLGRHGGQDAEAESPTQRPRRVSRAR
jgi:F0F1-type ATP synthase alpha subunit